MGPSTDPTPPAADHVDVDADSGAGTDAAEFEPQTRPPPPRSSVAMMIVATVAVIAALAWGRRLFVPVVAGAMLAMLLAPSVAAVGRSASARYAATVAMLSLTVATLLVAAYAFSGQLLRVTDRVPELLSLAADRLEHADPGATTVLARTRAAMLELDRAATRWSAPPRREPTRARAQPTVAVVSAAASAASAPTTPISDTAVTALRATAVSGTGVLLVFAGDVVLILFIALFILAGGKPLADRFCDLWGPEAARRRRAQHALAECSRQVRLYAWVLLAANAAIGLTVWLVFSIADLPDAAGWGVAAGVLHLVPYLGMVVLTALGAAEAFLAHGTATAAIGIAGAIVLLSALIGTVGTAVLQGRAARMNAAAVFIGLVFWGAVWGLWGLFLGPPLVVALKVIAEHMRSGQRLARVLQG
jgi:predicted PurR-regulated permease PerM